MICVRSKMTATAGRIYRETILKEAQSIYPIKMDEFDTDIYAFNCANGTLHLNTLEFRPTAAIHPRISLGWPGYASPTYRSPAVAL